MYLNEFKISFKNGHLGYFKMVNDTDENARELYKYIGNAIGAGIGSFELIDLTDGKKTYINVSDITTFGYSKVTE